MTWEIETVYGLDDSALFVEINSIGWNSFFWDTIIDTEDPDYAQYQDNISSYTVPDGSTSFVEIQFDGSVAPVPTWEGVKLKFFDYVGTVHKTQMAAADITGALFKIDPTLTKTLIRGTWLDSEIEPTKPTWSTIRDKDIELKTVAAAYKTMSDNIAVEVYNVFKTNDEASANAFSQSWKIKTERAIDYIGAGLIAQDAIAGFSIGEALDTEIKIQSYYNEKVNELIVFDMFRDAQIMTYLVAKAAAEA